MIDIGEGLTERLARQADELSTKAIESLERNHRPGPRSELIREFKKFAQEVRDYLRAGMQRR